MRTLFSIFSMATIAIALPAQTHHTHKATTRSHTTVQKPSTPPEPGVAAVGEMPAATGTPQVLYALKYIDLVIGTGDPAVPQRFYTVQYTGWTLDGKKFDSSYDHETAFAFPAGAHRVIMGWDTGFEGMRVGGKRRLIVPYQLAYGEAGHPPVIPEKATLIFDVELLGVSETPPTDLPKNAPKPTATGAAAQ